MSNEQNILPNDLDSLISDNHIQMMKAALPYMNLSQQRLISRFVKISELRRTIELFEEGEVSAMGIGSAEERERNTSPIDMLNIIKPFGSQAEQDFIDLAVNFFQGFRLAGASLDNSSGEEEAVPDSTIPNLNASHQAPHRQNNPFNRMTFDQIKNFIPPEQQARFETMQMMMSAFQQMS